MYLENPRSSFGSIINKLGSNARGSLFDSVRVPHLSDTQRVFDWRVVTLRFRPHRIESDLRATVESVTYFRFILIVRVDVDLLPPEVH